MINVRISGMQSVSGSNPIGKVRGCGGFLAQDDKVEGLGKDKEGPMNQLQALSERRGGGFEAHWYRRLYQ